MKLDRKFVTLLVVASFCISQNIRAEVIQAHPEEHSSGANWYSSWINLRNTMAFSAGDKIQLKVIGDARNILVRLKPEDSEPTSSNGMIDIFQPDSNGIVLFELLAPHASVDQISIHSGREAFRIPLGADNGTAILVSADHIQGN